MSIATFLSLFIFMQSINVHIADVLKLDELMEHAQFHEEELGDDWVSFYSKHFGSESQNHIKNQHQEKHEKLPKHDHLNLMSIPVFVLSSNSDFSLDGLFQTEKSTSYSYLEMVPNFVGNDIFQPPIFS